MNPTFLLLCKINSCKKPTYKEAKQEAPQITDFVISRICHVSMEDDKTKYGGVRSVFMDKLLWFSHKPKFT